MTSAVTTLVNCVGRVGSPTVVYGTRSQGHIAQQSFHIDVCSGVPCVYRVSLDNSIVWEVSGPAGLGILNIAVGSCRMICAEKCHGNKPSLECSISAGSTASNAPCLQASILSPSHLSYTTVSALSIAGATSA